MPFVFIVIGILFLVVAIQGTQAQLVALLKSEFVGSNSFLPWAAAIVILAAIGYAKPVRPIADAFIGLIILVMILANKGGFFTALNNQIHNPTAPATPAATQPLGTPGSALMPGQSTSAGVPATGDATVDNILTGLQGLQ